MTRLLTSIACLGILAAAPAARGEVFQLKNDGQVRGEIVNKDESPRKKYVVQTASGGQVALDPADIKKIEKQSPVEIKYDRYRLQAPDTVEGQWTMAEWCRNNQLPKQRRTHLERILEIDQDHAEARRILGYVHTQGKWLTKDDYMIQTGHVRYRGAWHLSQEVEVMEQKRKDELAQKEWNGKLKRWRGWLDGDKAEQARIKFKEIRDPYAVPALAQGLAHENDRDVKLLYIETLARIGDGSAMRALVDRSLHDPDEEIRVAALDKIVAKRFRLAVDLYIEALKPKKSTNDVVNRAAIGLQAMNDPVAIGPLIEALVTRHKFQISKGGPAGQMSNTFSTNPSGSPSPFGGGGFSFGGGGTETVTVPIKNQDVLHALVALSGANFEFDIGTWRNWHAIQKKPQSLNARRD